MNFFNILTVISFVLSSYLALLSIYNSLVRAQIEILDLYKTPNIIYLKISVNNLSANQCAIVKATISNETETIVAESTHYDHKIINITSKTNGQATGQYALYSEKVPINVPQKSAISFFLAFPVSDDNVEQLCSEQMILKLKINKKWRPKNFDSTLKASPPEKLKKEVKR